MLTLTIRLRLYLAFSFLIVLSYPAEVLAGMQVEQPSVFLVSIGVNHYSAPEIPTLLSAVTDARTVEEAFKGANSRARTSLLVDATSAHVTAALEQVAHRATEDDVFVFYFAGHATIGSPEPRRSGAASGPFRLLLSDSPTKTFWTTGGLTSDYLRAVSGRIRARRQLFIFDTMIEEIDGLRTFARKVLELPSDVSRVAVERSIAVLAVSGFDLDDLSGKGGPIAVALREGLSKQADVAPRDGAVSVSEIDAYLRWRVHVLSSGSERMISLMRGPDYGLTGGALNRGRLMGLVPDTTWLTAPGDEKVRGMGADKTGDDNEAPKVPRAYALLVGTNLYDDPSAWKRLTNPVPDVDAIGDLLKRRYGFEVEVVRNPTRADFGRKLVEYHRRLREEDQFLVFVAGHGFFSEELFDEGFMVFRNIKGLCDEGCMSHGDFRSAIEGMPARQVLVVLDSCFSGTFDSQRSSLDLPPEVDAAEYVRRKLKLKTRQYITSGGKEYVPDGIPGHHSPFAQGILRVLQSGRSFLTFSSIVQQIGSIDPQPRYGTLKSSDAGAEFVLGVGLVRPN
jgi:hypothetical protein